MMTSKRLLAVAVSAALYAPLSAFATNGMNLEGYGPIATGMGGASMAYDNGTAAMMNNPATLGLMTDGNRVDVALGMLGPNVNASHPGLPPGLPSSWSSDSDAFYMPALGWAHKSGKLTYGVGAFAQGGMGTEYKDGGPGTVFTQASIYGSTGSLAQAGAVSKWREFSEVGVMRILFPVAYNVNDQLTVGGSVDYVRATMDLQMAMPGTVMMDMMSPNSTVGKITTTMNLPGIMGMMGWTNLDGGYFDFADNDDFGGKTEGSGFAGKLGLTYKASDKMTIGATYHSKTSLGDLEGNASMQLAGDSGAGGTASTATVDGKIKIKDFQWPQTFGLGFSYQENENLMVAVDLKKIMWSDVMKDFKMSFTSAMGDLDATMYQNWDDQTVVEAGLAYKATNAMTLRAGVNISNNPIPNTTVHYLFPAIVEDHYTLGLGYMITKASDVNFSMTYAPEVGVTGTGDANNGLNITHSQTSWQLMYSNRF